MLPVGVSTSTTVQVLEGDVLEVEDHLAPASQRAILLALVSQIRLRTLLPEIPLRRSWTQNTSASERSRARVRLRDCPGSHIIPEAQTELAN